MNIEIEVQQMIETRSGRCVDAHAIARIFSSPREGFDAGKLEEFERELTDMCNRRLREALVAEGAGK